MTQPKQYTWHKLADSVQELSLSNNGFAAVTVADKSVCIAMHHNNLFACTAKCPHAGGILANGYVDALGNIVCPMHRYKFNLQNGRNVSGEGYFLKTFPVEVRKDGVFIGFEENKFFNWLK